MNWCFVIAHTLRLLALAGLLVPLPAFAQSGTSGTRSAGDFDFYVLALSWSPGFCALEGDEKGRHQCRTGAGLDFVVHGLWPQFQKGFPSDCQPDNRNPSRMALEAAKGVYPDEGLARYQWRKHGTCSGKSPTAYFFDVRAAREKVTIPAAFKGLQADQRWNPRDLERAFLADNPGLRADMMSVTCRRDMLQEVRICLSRDLRQFVSCQQVDRSGCRTRDIVVPAPR